MIDALRAETERLLGLAAKATPGPWTAKTLLGSDYAGVFWPDRSKPGVHVRRLDNGSVSWADAAFIAAAHDLAALVRAQHAELRRVEAERDTMIPLIVRDVCELDPADSENPDVVCVHVDDLRHVLRERMHTCKHDFDEAPGQGYFCRDCGVKQE